MQSADYEKLGVFYLGQSQAGALLYESADLTTHATIIGMTGSGKTGLGIDIIEEAAMDGIPVIAIDPKGDLANLKLRFPDLKPSDFQDWIDPSRAAQNGQSVAEFASAEAKLWATGLKKSGQQGRIARLMQQADVHLYTPAMSAGQPISVLGSLAAPPPQLKSDADLYAERIEVTATSLLTLLGIDADPLVDSEHILLANIIKHEWDIGRDIELMALVELIQAPPFAKIGVVALERFYPQKQRFKLAMRFNALLASPSFSAWLTGVPLDIDAFMYHNDKPCISVMQISHLSDNERMFFVCLLLAELIAWMRKQKGTSSLRAVLYIDEMFGYMPPNANPPSKKLLLTLLKQARAFGLGVVLSSQNPVDLDYKGLANCGTWFLGRMQTQQDRDRVLDGLEGSNIERSELNAMLAGLDKREFLLHNVHDSAPQVFSTRWCMSYLAGPIGREQALKLCQNQNIGTSVRQVAVRNKNASTTSRAPVVEQGVQVLYLNPSAPPAVYSSELYYSVNICYISKTHHVDCSVRLRQSVPISQNIDFADALDINTQLQEHALSDASFAEIDSQALSAASYKLWQRDLQRYLRLERPLLIFKSSAPNMVSEVGESRAAFVARVQQKRREQNDLAASKLKQSYSNKLQTLESRALRAQQAVEREQAQASSSTLDTVITIGTGILGAVFGRKLLSSRNITSASRAIKQANRAKQDSSDIKRAEQRLAEVQAQIDELEQNFSAELADFQRDNSTEVQIDEIKVRANSSNISIETMALLWNGG